MQQRTVHLAVSVAGAIGVLWMIDRILTTARDTANATAGATGTSIAQVIDSVMKATAPSEMVSQPQPAPDWTEAMRWADEVEGEPEPDWTEEEEGLLRDYRAGRLTAVDPSIPQPEYGGDL